MQAYHNDPAIKEKYLARVAAHRAADELIKGNYWVEYKGGFKGCAVGCTIHGSDHGAYETELGIPQSIARLEDCLFEGMDNDLSMAWPERFLSSIQVGADLGRVTHQFLIRILSDPTHGVIRHAFEDGKTAIETIVALLQREINGGAVSKDEWDASISASRSAAWSAQSAAESAQSAAESAWSAAQSAWSAQSAAESAWSAAQSAAESAQSAAWSAARSAAQSAAESAWSAAESARSAWSAAGSAAESAWSAAGSARSAWSAAGSSAHYEWMSDVLIDLLAMADTNAV